MSIRLFSNRETSCFFNVDDDAEEDSQRSIASLCESQEEAMAVHFVYTMIRQLINQLPPKVKLSGKRWRTRFGKLDGSLQTFDIALRILEELLDHAPATLLVIVDGVEQVEESEAESLVSKVLLVLQRVMTETRKGKVVKVLYTTAGSSDALESLDEDFLESVEAEEGRPKHMKERFRSLEEFAFDSDATTISSPDTATDEGYSD